MGLVFSRTTRLTWWSAATNNTHLIATALFQIGCRRIAIDWYCVITNRGILHFIVETMVRGHQTIVGANALVGPGPNRTMFTLVAWFSNTMVTIKPHFAECFRRACFVVAVAPSTVPTRLCCFSFTVSHTMIHFVFTLSLYSTAVDRIGGIFNTRSWIKCNGVVTMTSFHRFTRFRWTVPFRRRCFTRTTQGHFGRSNGTKVTGCTRS